MKGIWEEQQESAAGPDADLEGSCCAGSPYPQGLTAAPSAHMTARDERSQWPVPSLTGAGTDLGFTLRQAGSPA